MKKSSIWKLLFSALTVFAVAVFAGCTDDNDDMGAPYLNVTPENLTFDAEGQPADEYNGTFIVETNRPWRAIVEDEQTWVRLSATEGEGDAAVTVTVPASNIGQSAKVTFEVYNSYGALIQKDVNVLQGEVVPPTIIFNETAGNEAVDDKPLVSAYTGWNTTGEGASKVSYEGVNTSIRASGKSSAGAYDGASGPNVIFFGSAPATFTVKDITLASDQTNLKLTFGGQYYDGDNNDNNFNKDNFVVYLSANGTDYTPLSYEVNDGDQVDPYWVFATKNFTLKNATSTLYIKFEAKASSKFRLDDITLMTGNGGEEIDLAGGGVVPPDPSGDAIYENNFDKTPAEKVDNKWPFLDQTDAWQNASGTGNSTVTYTSANVSVRTSGKLSGGYDGASGSNKIFFGSAPATFDINTITMPAGKTNYRIIFGGAYSQSNGGTYDNIFKPESFHVAVGNGTDWSGNLTYEKIGGSDTTDPYWVQFAVDFTLKEAVSQLSIRFTADLASVFAIDDVQLVEGNGGQEVDLEGGVVPPDPDATVITIPALIAQMTTTEAPVDANADRYVDGVVMNDVAGGNYTFNNLILATEGSTAAGNGITLYGSQVEPSTLGLNMGDKVRVTLYKGLAKVVNYNGLYEVTGAKEATWCKVEKTGTATVAVATITPDKLASYQGMAVTIANASVAAAGIWANDTGTSPHTFSAGGADFTVFCKKSDATNPSVFLNVPYKAATGNITGLAAVFNNASQLVPRNLADVAAFSDSSTPMITGVNPTKVDFTAAGGNETITVSVVNKGENALSVSGLSGLLGATVDNANNTVTVTAQPNTGDAVNQTLTITLAGGNSVTVPVTLASENGGGDTQGTYTWMTGLLSDGYDSKVDYWYNNSKLTVTGTSAAGIDFLRLGKSKFAGAYTTPALNVTGNKKLSFYAVGWSTSPATVYVRVNGGGSVTGSPINVVGNAGYSGQSSDFTMTLTASDYYTLDLTGLTATSTITISTSPEFKGAADSNNESRAAIIGLQIY